MKRQNPIPKLIVFATLTLLTFAGCKKSGSVDPGPIPDPAITSISPMTALLGSSVTITGTNFGPDISTDTVKFNGVVANISSANTTSIVVNVPANATTGKVSVITNGRTVTYPTDFIVKLPVPEITNVAVTSMAYGGLITINGSNFNPDVSKNTVTFAGLNATVKSASQTQLVAQVSNFSYSNLITSISGQLTVTSYGTTLTYASNINVAPYVALSFNSAAVGYLAVDAAGNIYGEAGNSVLKVLQSGASSTLATIGTGGSLLKGTAVDAAGNVYATGTTDAKIYKITPAGMVSTFAGSGVSGYTDGKGTAAEFIAPVSMAIDPSGNLFVCDSARVRKIAPDGSVTTFAGSGISGSADGQGVSASFSSLIALTTDNNGNVYVTNTVGTIRKITAGGLVSTVNLLGPLVGNGVFNQPVFAHGIKGGTQIVADPFGNLIVCNTIGIVFGTSNANAGVSFPIHIITPTGFVGQFYSTDLVGYRGIISDKSGNIYVSQVSYAGLSPSINKYSIR